MNHSSSPLTQTLHKTALIASLAGLILNSVTTVVTAKKRWHAPLVLNAWAFLPLSLSLLYHTSHILSAYRRRQQHHSQQQSYSPLPPSPSSPLADTFVTLIGFLAYLTLLIANGLTIANLWWPNACIMLLAYNSVPWIVLSFVYLTFTVMPCVKALMAVSSDGNLGRRIQLRSPIVFGPRIGNRPEGEEVGKKGNCLVRDEGVYRDEGAVEGQEHGFEAGGKEAGAGKGEEERLLPRFSEEGA